MREIQFEHPHQKNHFEFFTQMEWPHFSLVTHIEFDKVYKYIKTNGLHFTSSVVYLVCKAANSIPHFRRRIRGKKLVEHDLVHPSFTVNAEEAGVFSFCYVEYGEEFVPFSIRTLAAIAAARSAPNVEDEAGRDDFLFLSSIPWVHFTGMTHAMPIKDVDSVPRITWGKLGGYTGTLLPLSVQAHHAVVDGQHAGQFFAKFEEYCAQPELHLI